MSGRRGGRTGTAPYLWMAAGAVTLGVGAGLVSGAGVAQADVGTTAPGSAAPRPRATASTAPAQQHARDRRVQPSKHTAAKPNPAATVSLSTTVAAPSAKAVASAVSIPGLPSLPSPGVAIQQVVNVLTTVVNSTPIRGLLDAVAPVSSSSGVSAVRLPGSPVGTAMSSDGTHLFVTTAPVTAGWFYPLLPTAYSVTEIDTKTNSIVGIPVAVEGGASGAVMLSPDGKRAFLPTSTGVTVINTANSTVVSTVNLGGSAGLAETTPDGKYKFVSTVDSTSVTVTVLDGGTGTPTGTPVRISGFPIGHQAFSGNRGYLTTISSTATASTSTVTVIAAADNSIVGSLALNGIADGGVVISPDGTKAALATHDPFGKNASMLTLFDPRTGTVIGTPVPLDGPRDPYGSALFSKGGNRLSVIVADGVQSHLVVIDTGTGAPIAPPVTLAGGALELKEAALFGQDANLMYVASQNSHVDDDGKYRTTIVVVNTVDGTIVGSPLVIVGNTIGTHSFSVSPDQSRVFQTLVTNNGSAVSIIGTDGSLVAPTITTSGYATQPVVFSADGSRAYQATRGLDSMVMAIDAKTGSVIGNPVGAKGDLGDDLFVADGGNRVYSTTRVMPFEFVLPIPLPFPIVFSVDSTHINAIDTTAF